MRARRGWPPLVAAADETLGREDDARWSQQSCSDTGAQIAKWILNRFRAQVDAQQNARTKASVALGLDQDQPGRGREEAASAGAATESVDG